MKLVLFATTLLASLTFSACPASALLGGLLGHDSGPPKQSLCDKYSLALFNSTEAKDQKTLLIALVNTALIGSFSPLGTKNEVTGILNDGTFNDKPISLLKYFDGSQATTNGHGKGVPVAFNFLDGGGAAPLKDLKPADDDKQMSGQYVLLTHLYEYFGQALGCSSQRRYGSDFKTYEGSPSMSNVHRFMSLTHDEVGYFIEQVGLSATSFGVTAEDATAVGKLLDGKFNVRCGPIESFPAGSKPASQSVCLDPSCPLATPEFNCRAEPFLDSYPNGTCTPTTCALPTP